MCYNIIFTPAEDIVGVVDAILAKSECCTKDYISDFADISDTQTDNALFMAEQLGLIKNNSGIYSSDSFLARLIVSARNNEHRAAVMRLVLEQYEPYVMFRTRFLYTKSLDLASKQVKAMFSIPSSYKEIKNSFISIGTYSRSMLNDGANSYTFNQDDISYIEILSLSIKFKNNDDNALQTQLGEDLYTYIDRDTIFKPLSEAYSKLQNLSSESKSIIHYAGNAFESFLVKIAQEETISLKGKNGITQKADALASVLSKKHRGMIHYVAQVRNAADHGSDPDEDGKIWNMSEETVHLFPILVVSLVKDIYNYRRGILSV